MAFKLPSIKSKTKPDSLEGIANFKFRELTDKDEIGHGGFGTVYTARYRGQTVVIKKFLNQSAEGVKCFEKEAKLLASVKHPNIVNFRAASTNPYSIMLNLEVFDFKPFNQESKAYSLDGFLSFIDRIDEVPAFASIFPKVAIDIANGLQYLHSIGVIHRDMKPGNVLVSNLHYAGEQYILLTRVIMCQ